MSLRAAAESFGLTPEEFDRIVALQGREPNALEAAIFGAMWSEHCAYKNSKPLLRRLPTAGSQVLQGPGENAGVVDLGEGLALAFKVESHNHPSAVEPVQGAATGVGGILRDIFAMGARPIAVLDSLRFGPLEEARSRHLLAGVVQGIGLYGNAIGVPTVGGEIGFHPCYRENPLVNVMALGVMRREQLQSGTVGEPGNLIVYLGSKTGRDGLGGAVFASADLSAASVEDRPAVQVGDPFVEKLLLEACLEAYARGLVAGVQDMGAAGLTSSVAEMAARAGQGVELWLERVPRREAGLTPAEVMLSESQERMLFAVRPERAEALLALCARWELDAVVIGRVTPGEHLRLLEHGQVVGEIKVGALADAPSYTRTGREAPEVAARRAALPRSLAAPEGLAAALLALLASPGIASKRAVYRQFDHQVMTNTVVLPGEADAAVLRLKGSSLGVAASLDCNARYCYLAPKLGAMHAVAEAARNVASVGATPLAITNNLNFGNPTRPEVYFQLEQCVEGLREACLALDTPVTGGNVSLYNQFFTPQGARAIHPTPVVGMVGVLPDVRFRATMAFKRPGDLVYLVGSNTDELGASAYFAEVLGQEVGAPPGLDLAREKAVQQAVIALVRAGLCDTAHDCGEGGLAVVLAEMALAGDLGLDAALAGEVPSELSAEALLFGEAASRIVVAVARASEREVEARLEAAGVPFARLGTIGGERLRLGYPGGALELSLGALREAYEAPLRDALS